VHAHFHAFSREPCLSAHAYMPAVYGKNYKIDILAVQRSNEAEPVSIILQVNQNWYILFFAFLLSWLILLTIRKRYRNKREAKEQVYLSLSGLFALLLMEIFATSTNLWNYVPENWPIILWPTYFVAILFGYQLLRSIETLFS
jgi:fatty acid desaturase